MRLEESELLDFCQTFEDLFIEGLDEDLEQKKEPEHVHDWWMLGYDSKDCAVAICRQCGEIAEQ